MSTTQTLSNIATGLRAVDCELAAMRSLNGTLVSALTTVMGPRSDEYKQRYETGTAAGITELVRNDPELSSVNTRAMSAMSGETRNVMERVIIS